MIKTKFVIGGAFVLGSVFIAGPAFADEAPPAPVTETTPATTEIAWALPNGGTAENVTWPQTLTTLADLPCGVTAQVDTYYVTEAPKFTADGKLDLGEDYQNDGQRGAISWRFVTAPPCEVVVPPVEPPVDTTPPVVVTPPVVDTPVVVTPVEQPAPVAEVVTAEPTLAFTGATVPWYAWAFGGLLVIAGVAMKFRKRANA